MTQKAKIYLAEALILLMEHTELSEIRVKDLAKKAGVSRMTYYRYFSEKEEVLTFYMSYIFEKYMNTVEKKENIVFQSYEHILESLEFFLQYKDFALCLHKAKMEYILLDTLNSYIRSQPAFDPENATSSFPLYFYAGALCNTYMQWILSDTKTPAKELAHIIKQTCLLLSHQNK